MFILYVGMIRLSAVSFQADKPNLRIKLFFVIDLAAFNKYYILAINC
jgi:hypothetical protein